MGSVATATATFANFKILSRLLYECTVVPVMRNLAQQGWCGRERKKRLTERDAMGQGSKQISTTYDACCPTIYRLQDCRQACRPQKKTTHNLAIIGADGVIAINPIDFFTGTFCLQTTTWEITLSTGWKTKVWLFDGRKMKKVL